MFLGRKKQSKDDFKDGKIRKVWIQDIPVILQYRDLWTTRQGQSRRYFLLGQPLKPTLNERQSIVEKKESFPDHCLNNYVCMSMAVPSV